MRRWFLLLTLAIAKRLKILALVHNKTEPCLIKQFDVTSDAYQNTTTSAIDSKIPKN